MRSRKSNKMFDPGRLPHPGSSPGNLDSRGWWKGIHDELISFMNKPHLVHQLTKRIVHFASGSLKRSSSSGTDSNCSSLGSSPRPEANRMAKQRVEEVTKTHSFQSDNDSHEENNVVRYASPCRIKRKRRKTPLRAIQHIIGKSLKSSCTVVHPKPYRSQFDRFEAYGHPIQQCYVVLENILQEYRKSTSVKPGDHVDQQQAEDESNSSPEKTDREAPSKNNEEAAESGNNVASHRVQAQDPTQPTRLEPEQQKANPRKTMNRDPDSSDDEVFGAFNEVFSERRNCELLESDTEGFWAERKRFRKAIDYEKEARELLGLQADFSTPIVNCRSPLQSSSDTSPGKPQRRQGRPSPISTPNNSPGEAGLHRRRSSAQVKSPGAEVSAAARNAQKTPKWQQAKQVSVKVSRSGRLIKPPVDDSFV